MTQQHSITPPPELVQQWRKSGPADAAVNNAYECHIAIQAAQWGADHELEACCEYLVRCAQWEPEDVAELRAARRPKPPSLKEQALAALNEIEDSYGGPSTQEILIRRALEALPDG
jgi:hypothetical protein